MCIYRFFDLKLIYQAYNKMKIVQLMDINIITQQ